MRLRLPHSLVERERFSAFQKIDGSRRREALFEKAALGGRTCELQGAAIGFARGAEVTALGFELADGGGEDGRCGCWGVFPKP